VRTALARAIGVDGTAQLRGKGIVATGGIPNPARRRSDIIGIDNYAPKSPGANEKAAGAKGLPLGRVKRFLWALGFLLQPPRGFPLPEGLLDRGGQLFSQLPQGGF
jgi:hypothetical protein